MNTPKEPFVPPFGRATPSVQPCPRAFRRSARSPDHVPRCLARGPDCCAVSAPVSVVLSAERRAA